MGELHAQAQQVVNEVGEGVQSPGGGGKAAAEKKILDAEAAASFSGELSGHCSAARDGLHFTLGGSVAATLHVAWLGSSLGLAARWLGSSQASNVGVRWVLGGSQLSLLFVLADTSQTR